MVLSQRLKAVGEQGKRAYSGFQSAADIMNCMTPLLRKRFSRILRTW